MSGSTDIERLFRFRDSEIRCRFQHPVPDPSGVDFRCTYVIEWPERRREGYSCGVDELQALFLAMKRAHVDLLASQEYASGELKWLDSRDLGLPLPDNVTAADFE